MTKKTSLRRLLLGKSLAEHRLDRPQREAIDERAVRILARHGLSLDPNTNARHISTQIVSRSALPVSPQRVELVENMRRLYRQRQEIFDHLSPERRKMLQTVAEFILASPPDDPQRPPGSGDPKTRH